MPGLVCDGIFQEVLVETLDPWKIFLIIDCAIPGWNSGGNSEGILGGISVKIL